MTTRREFLAGSAVVTGGLLVGAQLSWARGGTPHRNVPWSGVTEFNTWIHIRNDNQINFILDKAEMGQGVITGLTAIVAEELDLAMSDIQVLFAKAGAEYGNPKMFGVQITGGSTSVAGSWGPLRQAAADVRTLMLRAGAQKLNAKLDNLTIAKSSPAPHASGVYSIVDSKTGAHSSFGELAAAAAGLNQTLIRELRPIRGTPKKRSEYKLLGRQTPIQRYDVWEKVSGRAKFGIDAPAGLNCVIVRCPVSGGKLRRFQPRDPRELGVSYVLPLKAGVAVVAPSFWQANVAARKLNCEWDYGPAAAQDTEKLSAEYRETAQQRGVVASIETALRALKDYGSIEDGYRNCPDQVEAVFELPYVPHSTMEPMNCTVQFRGDSCEIWAGTQSPGVAQELAHQITGIPYANITVNSTFLGGGFGRRIYQDYVAEAVHVAFQLFQTAQVTQPVKLIWTREDDFRHDYYRPMMVHRIRGGLNKNGTINTWMHHAVGQSLVSYFTEVFVDSFSIGIGSQAVHEKIATAFGSLFKHNIRLPGGSKVGLADPTSIEGLLTDSGVPNRTHVPLERALPYAIDTLHVETTNTNSKIPVGFWRSVGHSHTAFAIESFIDDLARRLQRDPFEYRQFLLREALNGIGRFSPLTDLNKLGFTANDFANFGFSSFQDMQNAVLSRLDGAEQRIRRSMGVLSALQPVWGKVPGGHYQGIAQHSSFDTYCAVVIEASVADQPRVGAALARKVIHVHRAFVAVDCGFALTPDIIKAQAESAVIFGLTAALKQKITIKNGQVQESGFHDCDLLRMHEAPQIQVFIVPSDEPPTGIGEPCVPPVAPALRNALLAATGVAFRRLPLDFNNPG